MGQGRCERCGIHDAGSAGTKAIGADPVCVTSHHHTLPREGIRSAPPDGIPALPGTHKPDRSALDYEQRSDLQNFPQLRPHAAQRTLSKLNSLRVLYVPPYFPDTALRFPPGCFATLEHVHMPVNARLYRQLISRCAALQSAKISCAQCDDRHAGSRRLWHAGSRATSHSAHLVRAVPDGQFTTAVRAVTSATMGRLGALLRCLAGDERDTDAGALSPNFGLRYLTIGPCSSESVEEVYSLDLCPRLEVLQIDYQTMISLGRVVSCPPSRMTMSTIGSADPD